MNGWLMMGQMGSECASLDKESAASREGGRGEGVCDKVLGGGKNHNDDARKARETRGVNGKRKYERTNRGELAWSRCGKSRQGPTSNALSVHSCILVLHRLFSKKKKKNGPGFGKCGMDGPIDEPQRLTVHNSSIVQLFIWPIVSMANRFQNERRVVVMKVMKEEQRVRKGDDDDDGPSLILLFFDL